MTLARPILYSFRRCPYAMRARLAIAASGKQVELREVVLRDKPADMLAASPKGTVPVLIVSDSRVIDESLDIMRWALGEADPEGWLTADETQTDRLIADNDGPFKHHLDRYKYANRYEDEQAVATEHRNAGAEYLAILDSAVAANGGQLLGPRATLADIAIFPFVRQFANTDRDWFDAAPLPALQGWLAGHLGSARFERIMKKYKQWTPDLDAPLFPPPA